MISIFILASAAAGAYYGFYKLMGFGGNMEVNSQAFKAKIDSLRARLMRVGEGNVIPWEKDTLPLVSLARTDVKNPGMFNNVKQGMFVTIYQEPVLAYVSQFAGKGQTIAIARTSNREFILRRKGKQTDIWVNAQLLGSYIAGALLASGGSSKVLGRLDDQAGASEWMVTLNNTTAATMTNLIASTSPNPRAFTLLRDLTELEEAMLLGILVARTV